MKSRINIKLQFGHWLLLIILLTLIIQMIVEKLGVDTNLIWQAIFLSSFP